MPQALTLQEGEDTEVWEVLRHPHCGRGLLPAWGGDRDPGGGHGEGQVRLVVGSAL